MCSHLNSGASDRAPRQDLLLHRHGERSNQWPFVPCERRSQSIRSKRFFLLVRTHARNAQRHIAPLALISVEYSSAVQPLALANPHKRAILCVPGGADDT